MAARYKSRGRAVAITAVVVAIGATSAALGLGSRESVVAYPAGGQTIFGVRPTATGLPDLGEASTVGVNTLDNVVRAYHDSGAYETDLAAVDAAARSYIVQRLVAARTRRRVCTVSYVRVPHVPGHGTLYQRVRRCRLRTEPLTGKPALVLDIDETSLSNYADLAAHNFDPAAGAVSSALGHGTAIQPTLRLFRYAVAHGVTAFFVTGRPAAIDATTQSNLRRAGYDGWAAIYEKPATAGTAQFKASARAAITKRGYEILANIGDQQSDLDGGHADRGFKLPNPFYFIPD